VILLFLFDVGNRALPVSACVLILVCSQSAYDATLLYEIVECAVTVVSLHRVSKSTPPRFTALFHQRLTNFQKSFTDLQ